MILAPFLTSTLLSSMLAFVAGIMVYISLAEILPIAHRYGQERFVVIGIGSGMLVMAASLFLLALSVYWRPLQAILHTVSLGPVDWLIAFGFGLFNILLIEGVKLTSAYARQK